MKVVVFGGSGFLGRAVMRGLESAGAQGTAVDEREVDITQLAAFERLKLEADAVLNLAARVPTSANTLDDSPRMFSVNAIGAANVATWAAARGIRRLVHCSTLAVVARPWPVPVREDAPTYPAGPVAAYAASKLAGEIVAGAITRAAGSSFAAVRFSALYGPSMAWTGVLPAFIDAARAGKRLTAAEGAHADFLHVDDAARAVVRAAGSDVSGVVNVASGVETSIAELARQVLTACGRATDAVDVQASAASRAVIDVSRMKQHLGAAEISLAEGLRGLVQQ